MMQSVYVRLVLSLLQRDWSWSGLLAWGAWDAAHWMTCRGALSLRSKAVTGWCVSVRVWSEAKSSSLLARPRQRANHQVITRQGQFFGALSRESCDRGN